MTIIIEELVKKASKKLYFLIQLNRAQVSTSDLVTYFCACSRSSLDYACPVFHYSLPKYVAMSPVKTNRFSSLRAQGKHLSNIISKGSRFVIL